MSDVFILGAGFSKAVSADMPLLVDLSHELEKRVTGLGPVTTLFPENMEMWLTYLSQDHPWLSEAENLRNHALFLDLSLAIREIFVEQIYKTTRRQCPKWFLDLARWWHGRKATVLTLNYDTLIERCVLPITIDAPAGRRLHSWDIYPVPITQALQRGGTGYNQFRQAETFRLFKLHGSINWFYSGKSPSHGETLYSLPHVNTWDEGYGWAEDFVTDKIPFIVPPLTEKLPYFQHETVRTLWSQAAAALRSASRVFCCGYSLPVTDITMRFFLSGNCPAHPLPLYIADTCTDRADHFRSHLPTNYFIDKTFTGADPIPRLTEALVAGDLDKT
jgi:hypothetical protein